MGRWVAISFGGIGLLALAGGLLASTPALAWDQHPFDQYLQRSDTIDLGAGDAQDANIAIQTIDPWPHNVGNNHIPGNGERMSGAIERYRDVEKIPRAPKPIEPIYDVQSSGTGGGH